MRRKNNISGNILFLYLPLAIIFVLFAHFSFSVHAMSLGSQNPRIEKWNLASGSYYIGDLDVFSSSETVEYENINSNVRVEGENYFSVSGSSLSEGKVVSNHEFQVSGKVKCEVYPGCRDLSAFLSQEGDVINHNGDLEIDNEDSTLKYCEDLQKGETCEVSWEVIGREEGDYSLSIKANDSEDGVEEGQKLDVSVLRGEISLDKLRLGSMNTKKLEATISYNNTVETDVVCILNNKDSQSFTLNDISSGADNKSSYVSQPSYESENELTCEMEHNDISDRESTYFEVKADISSVETDRELYDLDKPEKMVGRCNLYNIGDVNFSEGNIAVDYILESPSGETIKEEVIVDQDFLSEENINIEKELDIPENPENGTWEFRCSNLRLLGAMTLDSGHKETRFDVVNLTRRKLLNLTILEPKSNQTFVKGDKISLKANLRDFEGKRINESVVKANGVFLNLQSKGSYSGNLVIPNVKAQDYEIVFSADSEGYIEDRESVQVNLKDEFFLEYELSKQEYRIGDTLSLEGEVTGLKDKKEYLNVTAEFYGPEDKLRGFRSPLLSENRFSISLPIKTDFPKGEWSVRVLAKSENNEVSENKTFEVLKAPQGDFYFDFELPENRSFKRGEKVPVEVNPIDSEQGSAVELTEISCGIRGEEIDLKKNGIRYSGVYEISSEEKLGTANVKCRGTREHLGRSIRKSNSLKIVINPLKLDLRIIEPKKSRFKVGETLELKVNVSRQDRPLDGANVSLFINGRETETTLNSSQTQGIYKGSYDIQRPIHSLSFRASDKKDNFGRSVVKEIDSLQGESWDWSFYLIALSILFVADLVGYKVYKFWKSKDKKKAREQKRKERRKDNLKGKLDDLKVELRSIESSRKEAQENYYKREIDEKTFKQMMQKYEQERTEIRNKIDQIKKELDKIG